MKATAALRFATSGPDPSPRQATTAEQALCAIEAE